MDLKTKGLLTIMLMEFALLLINWRGSKKVLASFIKLTISIISNSHLFGRFYKKENSEKSS